MICFDTMILIWGVQGRAKPGQTGMIDRTRRYINSLSQQNEQIMLPTPVLAEYLEGFESDSGRKRQLELLEKHFIIASFNLPAAYLAAGLARKARGQKRSDEVGRQAIKTDFQIISTAFVHGANSIVTQEKESFEKMAAGKIQIVDVPNVHEQTNLDLGTEE